MQADIHVLRYERDNRIITGGSLILSHNWQQRLDTLVTGRLNKLLPGIGQLSYINHWSGVVGMTPDYFPHLYAPAPGVWAWTGCNGRGISLSTRVGSILADAVGGKDPSRLPLPISELKEIPLHSILDSLLKYSLVYYRGMDWIAHRFR
jgi:glycine/D-amino acid oxidase-like deaminating enzyme